jgi:hypothetical protein
MFIITFAGTQTPACSTIFADDDAALRKLYELMLEFERPLEIMSPLTTQVLATPMDITSYIITFAGTARPACSTIFTDLESALHEIDAAESVLKAPLDLLIVGAQPAWAA